MQFDVMVFAKYHQTTEKATLLMTTYMLRKSYLNSWLYNKTNDR